MSQPIWKIDINYTRANGTSGWMTRYVAADTEQRAHLVISEHMRERYGCYYVIAASSPYVEDQVPAWATVLYDNGAVMTFPEYEGTF